MLTHCFVSQLVMTGVAVFVVDKVGRRPLLLGGVSGIVSTLFLVFHAVLVGWFHNLDISNNSAFLLFLYFLGGRLSILCKQLFEEKCLPMKKISMAEGSCFSHFCLMSVKPCSHDKHKNNEENDSFDDTLIPNTWSLIACQNVQNFVSSFFFFPLSLCSPK